MFTQTFTRKKLLRTAIIVLAVLVGAGIIIMAVMSSFKVAAEERKLPIYGVSRADNKVAVTFDCAWGNSNTDLLLSLLKEADIKATFFVTGEFCDKYPKDVKKMYDAGHEIGNHSDKHPHVEGININDLIEDTKKCSEKIKMITGEEPKLYRAPYGEYDDNVVTTIEGMGYKMIQWSVDSIDWQEPDPDTITDRIMKGTVSGSILLFHNDLENTSHALPEIITKLKQKGFSFSGVSELVYYDSYHIDSNGIQIYDASALLPAAKYSDNYLIDEAMEIFRKNLTLQEIYDLTGGATPQLLEKTAPLLDSVHLAAIQEASFEELKEAVQNLIRVAENEGAGENAGNPAATGGADNTGAPVTVPEVNDPDNAGTTGNPSDTQTPGTDVSDNESIIGAFTSAPGNLSPEDIKGGIAAPVTLPPVTTTPEITTPVQTTPAATTPAATTPAETSAAETTAGIEELIK